MQWARRHHGQVEIVVTSVFAEFQVIRAANPRARSRGRGERSALEVLNAEIDGDPDIEALLLFEDNDVRKRNFVQALPERVTAVSTGDLLQELEAAGRIQSADQVLDAAAARERNVAALRNPRTDDGARAILRAHLADPAPDPRK